VQRKGRTSHGLYPWNPAADGSLSMLLTPNLPLPSAVLAKPTHLPEVQGPANKNPPANSHLFAAAEVQCPVPTIPHGRLNPAQKNLTAGSAAMLECDAGYVPAGSNTVKCLSSGRLQPRAPACTLGTHGLFSWSFSHAFVWVYLLKAHQGGLGPRRQSSAPSLGVGWTRWL